MVVDKIDPAYLYLDSRFGKSNRGLSVYCILVSVLPLMCLIMLFLSPYIVFVEIPKEIADFGLGAKLKLMVSIFVFAWIFSVYYLACFYRILTWELPKVVNWIKQESDYLLVKPVFGEAIRVPVSDNRELAFERLPQWFWHYPFSYIRTRFNQCYKLKFGDDRALYVVKDVADAYGTEQKLNALKRH